MPVDTMNETQNSKPLLSVSAATEPAECTQEQESKAHKRAVRILKLARLHYRRHLRAPVIFKVVHMIGLHPDDKEDLDGLRRDLAGWRVFTGTSQSDIGKQAGVSDKSISCIERGDSRSMFLPVLCKYAEVFRLVINVRLEDLGEAPETDEIRALIAMTESRPHSGVWLDALLLAVLANARTWLDIPADLMARKLELKPEAFAHWEEGGPAHLYQLMAYARELGGRMRVSLARLK